MPPATTGNWQSAKKETDLSSMPEMLPARFMSHGCTRSQDMSA